MNKLYLGFSKQIDFPKGKFLFINDEIPNIPKARIFEPTKDCFNPLQNINYRSARELADALYTIAPQGENTLTVRNGKRALLPLLLKARRFDNIKGDEEVTGMVDDLLNSPVLNRVLCTTGNQFSFNPNSIVLARLNRRELGDFDALVLGLFLMNQFKGQIIVPDGGFYLREAHVSLIREERLIIGLNTLSELPLRLRQAVLLIKDKDASGALFEDADTLARYSDNFLDRTPDTHGYNDFVTNAMK